MNAQGDTQTDQNPGGGGPVVAIVLGVVIIIGAVVLVMTLGQNDGAGSGTEAPKASADAHAGHDHDGEDHGDHAHDESATEKVAEAAKDAKKAVTTAAKETKEAVKDAAQAVEEGMAGVLNRATKYFEENLVTPGDGVEALPVELPNPAFAGTPKEIPSGARMKKLTGKDRGAYLLPSELAESLENVALDAEVTSSDSAPLIGDLDLVTDGDKEPLDGRWVELAPGLQWVQIDLGEETEAFAVLVWHNHMELRVYKDIVIQVSNDPDFVENQTIFNNDFDNSAGLGKGESFEYFENYEGLLVPLYDPTNGTGVKFRYLRAYSKGSTSDDANHYTEIEIFAKKK